jgi:hypothetical protein
MAVISGRVRDAHVRQTPRMAPRSRQKHIPDSAANGSWRCLLCRYRRSPPVFGRGAPSGNEPAFQPVDIYLGARWFHHRLSLHAFRHLATVVVPTMLASSRFGPEHELSSFKKTATSVISNPVLTVQVVANISPHGHPPTVVNAVPAACRIQTPAADRDAGSDPIKVRGLFGRRPRRRCICNPDPASPSRSVA